MTVAARERDLLDYIGQPKNPVFRNAEALPDTVTSIQGDLLWMADDHRDYRRGGKWFVYISADSIWRCIDPWNQFGINGNRNSPPDCNEYGNMRSCASALSREKSEVEEV